MPGKHNKIFCIGWLKTGTTSFGKAMQNLGFKHCGWDKYVWRELYKKGKLEKLIQYAQEFESFDDLPWNKIEILKTLDDAFPGSGFVLLEREPESWFKSFERHKRNQGYSGEISKLEKIQKLESRSLAINKYFSGVKNKQLLTMNITAGEGYEVLCPFLGVPVLNETFPHANETRFKAGCE